MSDLISRLSLKDRASEYALSADEYKRLCKIIDTEPTAYSVDNVISQLEDYGNEEIDCYQDTPYANCIRECVSKAIEIVKQGGVSDDISREAKQGKWILDEFTAKYGNPYRCSCCNIEFGDTYNYCPNCGAGMKKVVE